MNYLQFIDRNSQDVTRGGQINFLVSGNDPSIRSRILRDIYEKSFENGKQMIILDDSGIPGIFEDVVLTGYRIEDGMSGAYGLYNPLQVNSLRAMSRIRRILSTLEYDEKRKMKLIAYLKYIEYVENLGGNREAVCLTLETLSEYSTTISMRMKLQKLLTSGRIDETQQSYLLSRYSEVCEASADFEDMLYIMAPWIFDGKNLRSLSGPTALVYKLWSIGEDKALKNMFACLLQFALEDAADLEITIVLLDRGMGDRNWVFNVMNGFPMELEVHLFSEDIFTLCDTASLAMILNRFTARVYGRHLAMDSCQAVEQICGEIDVVKQSYTVNYDRRWKANRPLDVLFGKNKTEVYTNNAPAREPRYRKEMIAGFAPGSGIIEYMGNTAIFCL